MSVETQIQHLDEDINSLEAEIRSLVSQREQLQQEIRTFEAESTHKNLAKPKVAPIKPVPHETDEAPALIHYSYFDPSISKYFPEIPTTQNNRGSSDSKRILETISLKATAGHVALTESIMRFGGITAFPINSHLYDTQEDALLGLRFDMLSPGEGKFVTPHYIILRRYNTEQKDNVQTRPWHIFRYTTPVYVPLDQYSKHLQNKNETEGLQRFAEKIRSCLVYVLWKHHLFDQVQATTLGQVLGSSSTQTIVSVSRDLQCHHVSWNFNNSSYRVELVCDDHQVETSDCTVGDQSHSLTIQAMLCETDLEDLPSVFHKIVRYMHGKGLII